MNPSAEPSVLYECTSLGLGIITFNRPKQHHAFDDEMIQALIQTLNKFIQDPKVKLIVIQSTGASFCAGADLNWMKKMAHYSKAENTQDAQQLNLLLSTLYFCPKPTLAKIQGPAYGGAVGLIACCHFAIASNNVHFRFSEVQLGLIPAVISPYVIQAIGLRATRAYFLGAQKFNAAQAVALGLCYQAVAAEDLNQQVDKLIAQVLQHSPNALLAVNDLLNRMPLPAEISQVTVEKLVEIRASYEGQEGLAAFLEKRKPQWAGP